MENYRKGKWRQANAAPLHFAFGCGYKDVAVVDVKSGSHLKSVLQFALRHFQENSRIFFTGSGKALTKTISCVEIMKRKYEGLHQVTKIDYVKIVEEWNPLIPNLDSIEVTREVPRIAILLSKTELDPSTPRDQPPDSRVTSAPRRFRAQPKHGITTKSNTKL